RRRLSGPLLDRMDLLVNVERPTELELSSPPVTSSEAARGRIAEARERQRVRLARSPARCNGELDSRALRRHVRLEAGAERVLASSIRWAGGSTSCSRWTITSSSTRWAGRRRRN